MPEAFIVSAEDSSSASRFQRGSLGLNRYARKTFFDAGQDSWRNPPAQDPDGFEVLTNILPIVKGVLERRWGYRLWRNTNLDPAPIYGARMYDYKDYASGRNRIILTAGDALGADVSTNRVVAYNEAQASTTNATIFIPGVGATSPRVVVSRGFAYFSDSVAADFLKWDGADNPVLGTNTTTWGFVAPATPTGPISFNGAGSGLKLKVGREYCVAWQNTTTNHVSAISGFLRIGPSTTADSITIAGLPTVAPVNSGVNRRLLLATSDGGSRQKLFLVQSDVAAYPASVTDSLPDTTTTGSLALLNNAVYLEIDSFGNERGCSDNLKPPGGNVGDTIVGTLPFKHRQRLFLSAGQFLYFSKALGEVITSTNTIAGNFEECWPPDYQLDVSSYGQEVVTALFSDGENLYIGTNRNIRKLSGDGPGSDTPFIGPVTIFNEAGVFSQDVWRMVFLEGAPVGTMWLTPDFKVILSDFNTYEDVGKPIQDVLNSINNTTGLASVNAVFFARGSYELYILAIPTGGSTNPDTLCIFNLKTKKWVIWKPTDVFSYMLYYILPSGGLPTNFRNSPILLLANGTNKKIYHFDDTLADGSIQDRVGDTPVNFPISVQTPWLDFEDPTLRKTLNELEVITEHTGMQVTVSGASGDALTGGAAAGSFTTPNTIVSLGPLVASPVKGFNDFKLYLAGFPTFDKFYKVLFTVPSAATKNFIDYYAIEFCSLERF